MGLAALLFAIGSIGGFLVGMVGIGGGLIYIAVLHSVFASFSLEGFEATRYILANALLVQAFAGIVASYQEHRSGLLHWREALLVGIPTAALSMPLSYVVKTSNWYKREYFLALFLVFLVYSILRILRTNKASGGDKKQATEDWEWEQRPQSAYITTGVLTGVIAAFAGLGGGIFIIPWLSTRHKLPVKQAIAIAIPAVVLGALGNTIVYLLGQAQSTVSNLQTGYVVWSISLPMIAGVLVFTQLGVRAATKVSTTLMRKIFALLLTVMALKLLIFDILMAK
ncbi:MAG: sulfite exporter TauE/SafE family protein [Deltaproteobacteria bacterium]|nr:MAG: sulfite exporter TauE/SafE family protein [Deltaproteobacteria bacterium]